MARSAASGGRVHDGGTDGAASSTSGPRIADLVPPPDTIIPSVAGENALPPRGAASLTVTDLGEARYHIPIWVPPGRARIEPQLSLDYASGAGNGLVGLGWQLSGLPRITRCRNLQTAGATPPPVAFDSTDSFCLDGQVLVSTSTDGTQFHAFRDDFSRVTAREPDAYGPTFFVQETKDGRILTFGLAGALVETTRQVLQGAPQPLQETIHYSHVRVAWALSSIRDRAGNLLTIKYQGTTDNGTPPAPATDLVPQEIDYTGWVPNPAITPIGTPLPPYATPERSIKFYYDTARPDVDAPYLSGVKLVQAGRLVKLEMYGPNPVQPGLLRTLSLSYTPSFWTGRSLLSSVMECDGQPPKSPADAGLCRQVSLAYTDGSTLFDDVDTGIADILTRTVLDGGANTAPPQLTVLDVNGDGMDDLLYRTTSTSTYHLRLSTGAGFSPDQDTLIPVAQDLPPYTTGPHALDFDGDGHTDVLVSTGTAGAPTNAIYLATMTPTGGWTLGPVPWVPDAAVGYRQIEAADLDGDRYPDLVLSNLDPDRNFGIVKYALNKGGTFAPPADFGPLIGTTHFYADLNGDGRTDLLTPGDHVPSSCPNGLSGLSVLGLNVGPNMGGLPGSTDSSQWTTQPWWSCMDLNYIVVDYASQWTYTPVFGDYNGDGLVDVANNVVHTESYGDANGTHYESDQAMSLLDNGGQGYTISPQGLVPIVTHQGGWSQTPPAPWPWSLAYRVMDWNEDGKADLVQRGLEEQLPLAVYTWQYAPPTQLPVPPPLLQRGLLPIFGNPQQDPIVALGELPQFEILDVNGDGLDDIAMLNGGSLHLYLRHGQKPDLLKSTSGSFGPALGVTYKVVTPDMSSGGCKSPVHCVTGRMWIVDTASVDNGLGRMNSFKHYFMDGRTDMLQGHFLGFRTHSIDDMQTRAYTTRTFDLSPNTSGPTTFYPLVELPTDEVSTTELQNPVVGTILHVAQKHTGYDVQGTGPYTVEPVLVAEAIDDQPTGQPTRNVSLALTRQSFDAYGNVILRTQTWPNDGATTTETITYQNQPANWLVAMPRLRTVTSSALGETTTRQTGYEFDVNGQLFRRTDDPGNDNGTTFDPLPPQPDGVQTAYTEYERDPTGLPATVVSEERTDGTGQRRSRQTTYDTAENLFPTSTTDPMGHTVQTAYHPGLGVLAVRVDENGVATRYQYDTFGRTRAEHPVTGDDRSITYRGPSTSSPFGSTEDARRGGDDVVTQLDSLGRNLRSTRTYRADGQPVVVTTAYDPLGHVTSLSRPFFAGATSASAAVTTYDLLGREISVTYPDGSSRTRYYLGRAVATIDTDGNEHLLENDGFGNPVLSADQVNASRTTTTHLAYGPFRTLETITDGAGFVTRTQYDRRGRPRVKFDPDSGPRKFLYDVFGEKTDDIRGGTWNGTDVVGGVDTTTSYDLAGRILTQVAPDATQTTVWDTAPNGIGRVATSQRSGGPTIHYSYDAASRLTARVWDGPTGGSVAVGYAYDAFNRPATVTYPAVPGRAPLVVQNVYSAGGQLIGVQNTDGTPYWTLESSDASEAFPKARLGNGVESTWTEDAQHPGWLSTIAASGPAGAVEALTYHWDDHRRLRGRDDGIGGTTETFDYDSMDRLQHWSWSSATETMAVRYDYDDSGNLLDRTVESGPGSTVTYTYDPIHFGPHQPASNGAGAFAYDAHGNQTGAPGRTMTFDQLDLATSITTSAGAYQLRYDGELHRASRVGAQGDATYSFGQLYELRVLPDGNHHVFNIAAKHPVAQIETVEAGGTVKSESVTYVLLDHAGSVDTLTDAAGKPTPTKYDPFGARVLPSDPSQPVTVSPLAVRIGFTGHEHDDDLGLIDMVGRIYDPAQQRFLSEDPAPPELKNTQALNPYTYVFNNPLNFTDPSGFDGEPNSDDLGPVAPDPYTDYSTYTPEPTNFVESVPEANNQSSLATQGSDGQAGTYATGDAQSLPGSIDTSTSQVPFGPSLPEVVVLAGPDNPETPGMLYAMARWEAGQTYDAYRNNGIALKWDAPYVSTFLAAASGVLVEAHASPGSIQWGAPGNSIGGSGLAQWLKDKGFQGTTIVVGGCNAGTTPIFGNSVIRDVADTMGGRTMVFGFATVDYWSFAFKDAFSSNRNAPTFDAPGLVHFDMGSPMVFGNVAFHDTVTSGVPAMAIPGFSTMDWNRPIQ